MKENFGVKQLFKRYGAILSAIFLYAITCGMLYYMEFVCYGGAVRTSFWYVLIFPPLMFIFIWMHFADSRLSSEKTDEDCLDGCEDVKKHKGIRQWWQTLSKVLSIVLPGGCTLLLVYVWLDNRWLLIIYQYFAIMALVLVLSAADYQGKKRSTIDSGNAGRRHKRHVPGFVCAIFLALIAVNLFYSFVIAPHSVSAGQKQLAQQGYENIIYEGDTGLEAVDHVFESPEYLSDQAAKLGFYMFSCEKDGQTYGVCVSVTDGNIVALDVLDGNDGLKILLDVIK